MVYLDLKLDRHLDIVNKKKLDGIFGLKIGQTFGRSK